MLSKFSFLFLQRILLMKILILDNYDSFTYNLAQMVEEIMHQEIHIAKNDEISLEEIELYDKIILSPGPGIPEDAGILLDVIKKYASTKSIFGVCLGQQAIAEAFGGSIINLSEIFHGVASNVNVSVKNSKIFRNLPKQLEAGRYHSWSVDQQNFPDELEITAVDDEGIIMALQHKTFDVHAVQFHPESILTPLGKKILNNFLFN